MEPRPEVISNTRSFERSLTCEFPFCRSCRAVALFAATTAAALVAGAATGRAAAAAAGLGTTAGDGEWAAAAKLLGVGGAGTRDTLASGADVADDEGAADGGT